MNEKKPFGTRLTEQTRYRLGILAAIDRTSLEGELDKLINEAFKFQQRGERTLVDSRESYETVTEAE